MEVLMTSFFSPKTFFLGDGVNLEAAEIVGAMKFFEPPFAGVGGFKLLGFVSAVGLAKGLPLKLLLVVEFTSEFLQFLVESGEGDLLDAIFAIKQQKCKQKLSRLFLRSKLTEKPCTPLEEETVVPAGGKTSKRKRHNDKNTEKEGDTGRKEKKGEKICAKEAKRVKEKKAQSEKDKRAYSHTHDVEVDNTIRIRSSSKNVKETTAKGKKLKSTTVGGSQRKEKIEKKVVVKSTRKKKSGTMQTIRVRTTPRPLCVAIQSLNDYQKRAVEDMGFGGILKMRTYYIPSKLAFYLVDKLDTCTMELRLGQGTIKLNTKIVHDMLGTPIGGVDIYLTDPAPRKKNIKKSWRSQFAVKRVRISDVMKKVEESDNADFEFQINFLMLFLSTMAECNSCGHCNPAVLNYLTEDIDISSIDWSKYLLYADLTECKKFEVERRWPAITVWNMDYLRRREYLELKDGGFGTWPLIVDDGTEKDKSPDDFVERTTAKKDSLKNKLKEYKDCIRSKMDSILAQKQSIEMLIENAISDFPLDRDLRIMSRELQSMFGQEDISTGDVVNNETQIQLFQTPKRTAKGSKKRMDKESRDMEKSPDSTAGMQIVPGASLVDSPIWNSP
ncbi:hypothetical protein Ccrd_004590 [Cynara cardunculus var. scolymus]|uniref:Uncharacterized protein n=1 Tax=Cynara cardunculus var. scolymus TaxID=59895 RepID=A0A103XMQ1_CYNCS|nr:hypothetical protein Ccrd_004590 [Cynara cardunculus var. scolymus]